MPLITGRFPKRWRDNIPALVFLLICLILWQIIVNLFKLPLWLIPSPAAVMKALWNTRELLWSHTLTTLYETTAGFVLSIALGLTAGVAMVLSPLLKRMFYPLMIVSQTVPLIAVAPLLILWLGYGLLPKIVTVVLVCFFPITVSLIDGLEVSDEDLLNLLKSMGASRWQILYMIRWPNALPSFFAGLKIAATYSVMGAVIGEWLGASSGLGVYLTRSSHSFRTDQVFAAIVAITVLSLFYFALIAVIRHLALPWLHTKGE
ncbi:ABC-type nitrate/sulfonate/bicarbonate transport system, permease component [Desulfosporosinus acidiphilus SJ4]|uniref:ABC-type nitrate/sulfonate/bicarbonate transport system, permease component n=1 Tax=Desulfosporosinus acidiphilus (strain DSM 22704 / JCM 16185 / SJ4) TaxID=646529 RepID=I4D0K1_DESAJ|nr:ABC transporter permease [Desulfosporosinus acidiphilus]AFM39325.1 ABC-type nitrate/sulfonate/bicarbonate transport system, permease component [Desulfosporosinus acidiphilus SJ4]